VRGPGDPRGPLRHGIGFGLPTLSENEKELAKDVRELLEEVEALEDRRKKLEADNSDLHEKLQKAENELRLRD
jgi:predicted nuclease with TOPRIM domain